MVSRKTLAYGLTANVVVPGFVSLFTDVSSEMILPILPFFLIQVLSANALIVGLVEGVAESVGTFSKIFSGRLSDSAGKRKRFVAAGYGLSTAMKVLFPFAQSWPEFLGMRILERTGKGVRDAPRDALLTESTPPSGGNPLRPDRSDPALCAVQRGLCGPRIPGGHPLGSSRPEARRPDWLRRVHRDVDVARRVGRSARVGRRVHPIRPELRNGGRYPARAGGGLRARRD